MHKWILLNPGKSATPTDVKRYIDYVKEVIARATGESPLEVDPHQTGAYYSEQGHARGRWVGSWAHTLGLEGRPTDQELELMMLGQNPNTGERFWDDGKKPDNLALEILFTVPKSLSIYWDTCGDPWIRQEIERCIWDAYESSSKLLEDKILPLRRGHAGHRHIASEGLATAAFLHTGSRDGDMHLHIHGVTSIFSQGLEDGQISALHTGNLSKTNMTKLVGYAGEA
jgi:conjugative relaxase-like TrwC/TraI family protein